MLNPQIQFHRFPKPWLQPQHISVEKGYIRCRYRSLQHLDNLEIACLQLGSVPMTSLQDMGLDLRKPKSISIDSEKKEKERHPNRDDGKEMGGGSDLQV